MVARRLLASLGLLTSMIAPAMAGCTQDALGANGEVLGDGEDEGENEPTGESNDELRSSVACQERTDTAYRAGTPFNIQVVTVGGKAVSKPTGHAFLKMQAAAHSAGVDISLSSGFRTMAQQQYFWDCYQTKKCNNGNLAARPGHSNHQSGSAVDLTTSTWLKNNAARFGFVRTVPSEPWHYEFRGSDPGGPCARGGTTTTADPGNATTADEGESTPGGITWVAPSQGAVLDNGFVVKARASAPSIVKVTYSQGTLAFGTSTSKTSDFSLNYTFKYMGQKTLTARGYDASGKLVAVDHVDFTLNP